ncbi:hypothetical protein HY256_07890 [Candidatus Sumerlaeota bacterium]|nr:hypothetical protein [Candidatus Sumerlaeota bacterium]
MRTLAAILLLGYTQLVIHQVGHGHMHGGSSHAHLGHANPLGCDHAHQAALADSSDHGYSHLPAYEHGDGDPESQGDHEHRHYVHQHSSLDSLAPQDNGMDVPSPTLLKLQCASLDDLFQAGTAFHPSGYHSPPRGPASLKNPILRI